MEVQTEHSEEMRDDDYSKRGTIVQIRERPR